MTIPTVKKKQCNIYVKEEVLNAFRELVKGKYKGLQGMSYEVEQAMSFWLANNRTQTQAQKTDATMNPIPKVFLVMGQVKEQLKIMYGGFVPQQCSIMQLKDGIANVRGSDPRTVNHWLRQFMKYKTVKQLAPNVFEVP